MVTESIRSTKIVTRVVAVHPDKQALTPCVREIGTMTGLVLNAVRGISVIIMLR